MAMIDEGINEYLQIELVHHFIANSKDAEESQRTLDSLGFKVGYCLIERLFPDTHRLVDDISVMKYICKEFWIALFGKQIDNLRTNNSGIFVLQDNNFKLVANLGSSDETLTKNYLSFACGLLRGVLSNFGNPSVITYDIRSTPCCKFQINFLSQPLAKSK